MFLVETQLNEAELSAIYQSLNVLPIQGKDAKFVATLMDKIKSGLDQIITMKEEESKPPPSSKTPKGK